MVKELNSRKNLYKKHPKTRSQLCRRNTAKPTEKSPCQTYHARTKHSASLHFRLPCQHGFPPRCRGVELHGAVGGRAPSCPQCLAASRAPRPDPGAQWWQHYSPELGTRWAPPWQKDSQELSRFHQHAVRTGQKGTAKVGDRTVWDHQGFPFSLPIWP